MLVTAQRPQPGRPHELQGRYQLRAPGPWHWRDIGLAMLSAGTEADLTGMWQLHWGEGAGGGPMFGVADQKD